MLKLKITGYRWFAWVLLLACILFGNSLYADAAGHGEHAMFLNTNFPKTAAAGDTIKYTVGSLSGATGEKSDAFLLQCEIPGGMRLTSVYTGSYSDDVKLQVLCKTENEGRWYIWGEDISSLTGKTLDTGSFSLASGDRIAAFAIAADSVPEGFSLNAADPCYYYVEIDAMTGKDNFSGMARLSAYVGSEKASSESSFVTTVENSVQTGDSSVIYIASMLMMAVSILVLFGYIIVKIVMFRHEREAAGPGLAVKFAKHNEGGTHKKMSELLGKKPG